jgi:hypothetical protein
MKLQRILNPDAAKYLVPWFTPVNQTREEIFLELCDRMANKPDETFVISILRRNVMKGMAIAYCRDGDVFLWQARNEGLARKYVDIAFNAICNWARKKGFRKLVTIPNRQAEIWVRRWGFQIGKQPGEVFKEI